MGSKLQYACMFLVLYEVIKKNNCIVGENVSFKNSAARIGEYVSEVC